MKVLNCEVVWYQWPDFTILALIFFGIVLPIDWLDKHSGTGRS